MLAVVSPWLPVPGEPLPVGLTLVLPVGGKLDVGGEDADEGGVTGLELTDAGGDVETRGLAVLAGAGLAWQEGELVAWGAFLLPVALAVAVAEAVALAVLVALLLAVAVEVAVAVAAPVAEVLPLSLGLPLVAPPLPGLPLEMALDGAVPEPVGGTLGSALLDLADLDGLADEGGQAVACELLLWLADELEGPAPPVAEPATLPAPFRLGVPWLGLDEVIPTADESETKASRSGGRARTTPMANTAQAAARAGLSSPSRQSRGRCRAPPLPPRSRSSPPRPESAPPRPVFQRPVRAARKPPDAAERLLAWAGPVRTRARMRSSPSGCGST